MIFMILTSFPEPLVF